MAKQKFRERVGLSKENLSLLQNINEIIEEYLADDYTLTLRQLYYQLVSRDIIANKQSEYSKISSILVKGRMAGLVDWAAIEDRIRVPYLPYWVIDIPDAIQDTVSSYRLNRQKGQSTYIEVWVEKDALSGVLKRITSRYHVNLIVNRGYSSASAMYDAYKRFKRAERMSKTGAILYLGDHDPSGLDMLRDVTERLAEFGVTPEIHHIALTADQIKEYNPPPNPAKITDPRAKWYLKNYGNTSWEVDALPPKVLSDLLVNTIEYFIDLEIYAAVLEQEKRDIEELEIFANDYDTETE